MRMFQTISLVLLPALAAGCASSEKKDNPAATQPADVPAEGKPKAPALDVNVVATPGATPKAQHLSLEVLVKAEGQSLTAEFRLPPGVTAADPALLKAELPAVAAGSKHSFPLEVTLDDAVVAAGADVMCVVTVGFGGPNKDTVTRLLHVGAPGKAAAPITQPAATGTDATGKPVREARPAN